MRRLHTIKCEVTTETLQFDRMRDHRGPQDSQNETVSCISAGAIGVLLVSSKTPSASVITCVDWTAVRRPECVVTYWTISSRLVM